MKVIDNLYLKTNSILPIELEFVEKYKYKISLNLFLIIRHVFEQVRAND